MTTERSLRCAAVTPSASRSVRHGTETLPCGSPASMSCDAAAASQPTPTWAHSTPKLASSLSASFVTFLLPRLPTAEDSQEQYP
eukprot:469277-Rhodomonas_salina.4